MRRRANPGPARTIALVGLMGVGKSSVGRRLATRLRLPFADGDVEIEAAAGMTVSEIFAALGEDEFRAGEARVTASAGVHASSEDLTVGARFVVRGRARRREPRPDRHVRTESERAGGNVDVVVTAVDVQPERRHLRRGSALPSSRDRPCLPRARRQS